MGLEYITQPQVFTAPITALQGVAGINEAYPLLTTYQYWTSTAVVNTSSFQIPGLWTMLDNPGSFLVAVSGFIIPATKYTINRNNRFVNFNFVISAGTEVAFTQLATNAPSSQSFNYVESVSAQFYNLSALTSKLKDIVSVNLTAENISSINSTTNFLSALSATIQILDVTGYESSNLTIKGNTAIVGSLTVSDIISGNNLRTSFNQGSATGNYSFAEGSGKAFSSYSHAEGSGTIASGIASHAEGDSTTASGDASHAEGSSTIAFGNSSHTEGDSTTASGDASHAEGSGTTASGDASHAAGFKATAAQDFTYAWSDGNLGTLSQNVSTTRTGQYMVSASGGMFIPGSVGIGTDNNQNALTVNGTITATNILANTLTATNILANTLTATNLAVTNNLTVTNNISANGTIISRDTLVINSLEANRSPLGSSSVYNSFFDTASALQLEANKKYEVEYNIYYTKNTAGTVTYALSSPSSNTFGNVVGFYLQSDAGGITGTSAATLGAGTVAQTTAVIDFPATSSLSNTANHYARIQLVVETVNATLAALAFKTSAGTITPLRGSCRRYKLIN
jgi:hypothetical protein